jgi:L-ascorbate metabolism protein UlaG (beta-lactamase superfamily)
MVLILKKIMIYFLGFILLIILLAAIFINVSPEFGGIHLENRTVIYQESGLYKDGKFQNQIPTPMKMTITSLFSILRDFLKAKNRFPLREIPAIQLTNENFVNRDSQTVITWLGHSAFLIQLKGKNILLDPMFGPSPAPHPWLGTSRFPTEKVFDINDLPEIDAIVYSHDHYDHLDYKSVLQLAPKTKQFIVPLGIGAHLEKWNIKKDKIQELIWGDEFEMDDILLICTPARHFSGRGVMDRFSTLWASWVIKTNNESIYFSGDSGYGPHFKEIGEQYGPFDYAMMECGQYDPRWQEIHMLPSETVQAAVDLKAKVMQPIHWAQFSLSLHAWNDPAIQVLENAKKQGLELVIPKIGQQIDIHKSMPKVEEWWLGY